MNYTFSLQQMSTTGNLDSSLISRLYQQNLMADFLRNKNENPKVKQSVKQSKIANQLGYSSSTLKRYRNDINMVSPYRIQPTSNKKRAKKTSNTNSDNNSHCEHEFKRPQLTSNDLVKPGTNTNSNKENKKL